jgi:hypothetical protein
VHFEVLCTAKYLYGEKFLPRKIQFNSVREIRHQRLNSYLQTALQGKIAGPGQRYLFISGLPNTNLEDFFPQKANFGILLKNVLGPL